MVFLIITMTLFKKHRITVIPFKTYGTREQIYLKGMVFKGVDFKNSSNVLSFFFNRWKQFILKKVNDILIEITFETNNFFSTRTNSEGYYFIDSRQIHELKNAPDNGWCSYSVKVTDKYFEDDEIQFNYRKGEMLIPSDNCKFGVISDIDDTIMHTGVTSLLKWEVLVNTFFKSPLQRKPIKDIVGFCSMLSCHAQSSFFNPFFYVSSSPCNLYEYLNAFLTEHGFPKGPILLRDSRPIGGAFRKRSLSHKDKEIRNILKTYPKLKFILVGDCSEYDAELFLKIVDDYPGRIICIYLRAVAQKSKMKRIQSLFYGYKETPFCIFQLTEKAITHAKENGLIQ